MSPEIRNGEIVDGPFKSRFTSWRTKSIENPFSGSDVLRLSAWDQLIKQRGAELTLFEFLSFRSGYFDETFFYNVETARTHGIGLEFRYVRLDWSKVSKKSESILARQ